MAPSMGPKTGAWDLVAADDPTDWRGDFAFLRSMDASLRCDLCYDIYTAPVSIKDCGHTFCSACIRSAINKPGEEMGSRCPKCMNRNVYDSSLLPQPTLENAAQQWRLARPQLYKRQQQSETQRERLAEQAASASTSMVTKVPEQAPSKRLKRDASTLLQEEDEAVQASPPRRRSTRSISARQGEGRFKSNVESVVVDDTSDDEEEEEVSSSGTEQGRRSPSRSRRGLHDGAHGKTSKDYRSMQATDVVECPSCQHTFTYRALNIHLDKGTCKPGDPEPSLQERGLPAPQPSRSSGNGWFNNKSQGPSGKLTPENTTASQSFTPRKKLVRPNYDMLKGADLKRMLDEWRLGTTGERKRMVERHRKWINLYNANLDASERMRKSDAVLRKELQMWEHAQDEALQSGAASGVTEKKAKTWALDHRDDFDRLARQARESHLRDRGKHQVKSDDGHPDRAEDGSVKVNGSTQQEANSDHQCTAEGVGSPTQMRQLEVG